MTPSFRMLGSRTVFRAALALGILTAPALPTEAKDPLPASLTYQLPPKSVTDLVEAPLTPSISLSPDLNWILLMNRPSFSGIAELAQPELRLAGLRINPRTHGPSRHRAWVDSLAVRGLTDSTGRKVTDLPAGAKIENLRWSPDGLWIAFTVTDRENVELWVTQTRGDITKRVLRQRLNAVRGRPYRWTPDSKGFICTIVPEKYPPPPKISPVPTGPGIRENTGETAAARTYQDLLKTPHDEALFQYYLTAQLMRVSIDGKRKRLGEPGMVHSFSVSPDGRYLLIQFIQRPFSYLVPYYRFPRHTEIWDMDGNLVKRVAEVPLQESIPTAFSSAPKGPRSFQWRADAPASLCWVEAQDGGDARVEAEVRDKVFLLDAPFTGEPGVLASLSQRYRKITWGTADLAMIEAWWWKTRNIKTWMVRPGSPGSNPVLVWDRSWQDRYSDPGAFLTRANSQGRSVLVTGPKGKSLFLLGKGASPEGNRPFVDVFEINTLATSRRWRSQAPFYEAPIAMLDTEGNRFITSRESPDDPPNYFIRDLKSGELRAITEFPHPHPAFDDIQKELIRYERADGVKLSGTLYLPPGYKAEDGPLPLLMWAYPREFKSADAAGQITDSPYRFDRITWRSPLVWLSQGYAVLDDPKLPIVGEGDVEPNDSYVSQLVSGARAAIDAVARRGVADPQRVAIGGHSYGAFMVANLLAHSDLFRAGIARSGAYNRSLTPFGFQAEERTFWEAPEVYFKMSPFMNADKVNEPILLIHGEADNNSGTYPMQSERFYNALKGLGATARLVLLPHESHGYQARESILHVLWETHRWLETHVKEAGPREAESGGSPSETGGE